MQPPGLALKKYPLVYRVWTKTTGFGDILGCGSDFDTVTRYRFLLWFREKRIFQHSSIPASQIALLCVIFQRYLYVAIQIALFVIFSPVQMTPHKSFFCVIFQLCANAALQKLFCVIFQRYLYAFIQIALFLIFQPFTERTIDTF